MKKHLHDYLLEWKTPPLPGHFQQDVLRAARQEARPRNRLADLLLFHPALAGASLALAMAALGLALATPSRAVPGPDILARPSMASAYVAMMKGDAP